MDPFCNIFKDFFKLSFQLRRDIKAIPRTARAIAHGQKIFCSINIDKSRGEEIFGIPRWPFELPANQRSQSSLVGQIGCAG